MNGSTGANDAAKGGMEGHLRIVSLNEVEMAENGTPRKVTAHNYADYPLLIRDGNTQKEIARINADNKGNYHIALAPGDYVLDIAGRGRKHVRTTPRPFTILSGQTVRLDMEIDAGVR